MQSEERLRRLERATELPLLILALALVPMLIIPAVTDVPEPWDGVILAGDWFIWAVFAVDFTLKLAVAPRRAEYVRTHWLEAAMVVLPFLRPLRVLRLLRLARVGVVLGVNVRLFRSIFASRGSKVLVASVLGILVAGAVLGYLAERGEPGAPIQTFDDALWWAIVTMTTVGYGDVFPTTPMGRAVGVALMLLGIAALSALTASIAAFFVREQGDDRLDRVLAELEQVRAELEALRAAAARGGGE